jgi:DNA-binding NarL/FixJ family response regulator
LLAAGEHERALAAADELRAEHPHVENVTVHSWRSPRARALHALGRTEEALPLLEENVALARRWGAPSAVGRTLRELGEIKGEAGLPELEAAVEALAGSTARLELAKALAALGRTLRHARRPAEAREPLRHALELADACGAARLAEDVRAELYAAGARPRTAALSGAGALTASERRVAGLAAEGSSNRDIAQTLYVTPKTVEVHLSNAYRKLGIRSRRELAGALVEG